MCYLGAISLCQEPSLWERVVAFHGHECLGLAIGMRVSEAALQALGSRRAPDEELFAIVENDSCAVDAIQFVTGCTLGKGNLFFRDYGRQVYSFGRRDNGQAVRVRLKPLGEDKEYSRLRERVQAGVASRDERERFADLGKAQQERFFGLALADVCQVEKIELTFPGKARIFTSVACARCGERVMEPRARVRDGQIVCIPCSDEYQRRW